MLARNSVSEGLPSWLPSGETSPKGLCPVAAVFPIYRMSTIVVLVHTEQAVRGP